MADTYEFTTDWFTRFTEAWRQLVEGYPPSRMLEIGSYEGRSSCFLIETCAAQRPIELHCIDTWAGGVEHDPEGMGDVERRFDSNLAKAMAAAPHPVSLHKHKGPSNRGLAGLLADRMGTFDLIYVDGSHQASDVLCDAVFSFELLKVGGLLIFDDYLWSNEGQGKQLAHNMPKPAIDAFVNIYQRKLRVFQAPLYQLYMRKTAA